MADKALTLWLLRHAKAVTEPPPGGDDFDRVLAPRGRRDAAALGHRLAGHRKGLGLTGVALPRLALVSPAARTSATADLVLGELARPPRRRDLEALYGAGPDDVLAVLNELGDDVPVMVVGHNPTAHALSQGLISPDDKAGLSLAVQRGFPTCALGVYTFGVTHWADVTARSATLRALVVPPYEKP
jgi:phosphohistidine phosphatase